MRAKPLTLVPAIALALAACTVEVARQGGEPPHSAADSSLASDVLLVTAGGDSVALNPATGDVLFQIAAAVPGADGTRLYSALADGGETVLRTLDAATGEVLSSTPLRGRLEVRVVSASGRSVALMQPLPQGLDAWTPIPRSRTQIIVSDPTGDREPRRYDLKGNYEPEAFSSDDSRLFLIQHLPAEAPVVYRVTALDLQSGGVEPVFGRFKSPPERMPGARLGQVLGPDGNQLYTLYSSRRPAYVDHVHGATDKGVPVAFVHVLSLDEGWAFCAGVPKAFWGQPAGAQAVAASPDGARLYIVDSDRGHVSVMDTGTFDILRTEAVRIGSAPPEGTWAMVAPDGGTLFVGSAADDSVVVAIDTSTFEPVARRPISGRASGIGLSRDGRRLYVSLGPRVALLDSHTGAELASVPFSGADSIVQVSTPLGG
jgi:outer membrane protein assembly factor BamB